MILRDDSLSLVMHSTIQPVTALGLPTRTEIVLLNTVLRAGFPHLACRSLVHFVLGHKLDSHGSAW
jgi:hypothetical protein